MGDLRPAIGPALDAFGLSATITRPTPDNTPVVTTGFWLAELQEDQPVGREFKKRDPRRVFVVPRNAALPTAPSGSIVAAAEYEGGDVKSWKVDGFAQPVEVDTWRLILVPA